MSFLAVVANDRVMGDGAHLVTGDDHMSVFGRDLDYSSMGRQVITYPPSPLAALL
jgi:hypothetical protein